MYVRTVAVFWNCLLFANITHMVEGGKFQCTDSTTLSELSNLQEILKFRDA